MITPRQRALLIVGQGKNLTAEQIEAMLDEMEAEAFAAGERKGRIEGLREAAELANHSSRVEPIADHFKEIADNLERESKP